MARNTPEATPDAGSEVLDMGTNVESVIVSSPETPPADVKPSEPASMMEAVEQALGKSFDPTSESEAGTEAAGTVPAQPAVPDANAQTPKDDEAEPDPSFLKSDPTTEEVANYSRKAQARIRDLIEQRNEAASRSQAVEPILDFLHKNDIPQQDLDVVLDLTARLRHGDFAGFLQGVQPYVNLALQYTGQVLPADLRQKVQEGYVSPEIARELAQRRAQEQVLTSRHQAETQRSRQEVVSTRADVIRQTVTSWEERTRAQDPDYALKADVIRRTAQAYMAENGPPQTPQQALEYVNRAYAEVNEQVRRLRPQPKATTPNPSSTSSVRATHTPASEPNSMFDAAMKGLEAHRQGVTR